MRRKSLKNCDINLYNGSVLNLFEQPNGQILFEIGDLVTDDVAEAVSILVRSVSVNDTIWNTQVNLDIDYIQPKKCLYWLSGGDSEWITLHNYKQPWHQCFLDFQEEFGLLVIKILEEAKTLKDIRNGFMQYLNLPIIYDFALSKNLLR